MKRLLQLGFVLGLGGTIAAAYFAPWVDYPRYRSVTSVVANGGRVEQFMVRLPADRIGSPIAAPAAEAGMPARLEHFKLRDVDGNVIGILARHELELADGEGTAWLLTIPSRGTIALASRSPRGSSIDSALARRGLASGQSIDPELSIDLGTGAKSVAATGEFSGLEFELVETWLVTGLDDDGGIRGTLRLNTVGRRAT
jgi:hypothetical protein